MTIDGETSPSHSGPDDVEVISAVLKGNTDAFGVLVRRYQKRVYNLALRYCGDRQEAEDLAQEVFLRIFRALNTFRGDSLFSTWLYRIATNVCLDALRRQKNRPEPVLDQPLETDSGELERELVSPEPGPVHQVEAAELAAMIRQEVARLREPYRSTIVLRDLEDLTYDEIAQILNVSVGTVKSRLHRARSILRERFESLELLSPGNVKHRAEGDGPQ